MPWPTLTLRDRRKQVRDDIATHLPGADATVPNSRTRAFAEAMANLTHDNDVHLDYVARMMMPDTAEGEFADRWGNIWLPDGRKPASYAGGSITVTGSAGAAVPAGSELVAAAYDQSGNPATVRFQTTRGVTLVTTSATVPVTAIDAGALGNLDEGARVAFSTAIAGVDGSAVVAAPGFAGGADQESDRDYVARYIDRIQQPPHGGNRNDYVQWMLEVPGVTRAWAAQEMGIGTVTCRFMMDEVRASFSGFPQSEDLALVESYIDGLRPVTVADLFVVAPIAQSLNLSIDLAVDTPEVRANVTLELREMLRQRSKPGGIIYASWIREAISSAVGEDYHNTTVANQTPSSAGHIIVLGTITWL